MNARTVFFLHRYMIYDALYVFIVHGENENKFMYITRVIQFHGLFFYSYFLLSLLTRQRY